MPRDRYEPTHGDRVQIGFGGPSGVIVRRPRTAGGHYFKVKLESGEWVWPDRAVAESTGSLERTCTDCDIAFLTNDAGEVHCPNCARRLNGHDPGRRSSSWERHVRGSGR